MLAETLRFLRRELETVGAETDYVLFGSTVLHLHGLREPDTVGDVDLFLPEWAWRLLRVRRTFGWKEERPSDDDPPFLLSSSFPPVSAFYAWAGRDQWMSVERCFATAERVDGWNCISLETLRHHKRSAYADGLVLQKHLDDLAVLDRELGKAAA